LNLLALRALSDLLTATMDALAASALERPPGVVILDHTQDAEATSALQQGHHVLLRRPPAAEPSTESPSLA